MSTQSPIQADHDVEASWLGFITRMHQRLGGAPQALDALQKSALALLRATRAGNSCIALASPPPDSPLITRLTSVDRAMPGIDLPKTAMVFESGHLYLQRLWRAEALLAQRLLALNREQLFLPAAQIEALLRKVAAHAKPAGQQLEAIRVGLRRSLLLLSGGPGTGKTHTLARLMTEMSEARPGLRIALAAPTGKAAARLSQALAQASGKADWTVQTVHALVGLQGAGLAARHGPHLPLAYDLVVVDEASMLGLELGSTLLSALPDDARLILAGDGDQLSSVDPGSVFADLISAAQTGLRGAAVELSENFRQKEVPELARLGAVLRTGQLDASDDALMNALQLEPVANADYGRLIEQACARYQALLQVAEHTGHAAIDLASEHRTSDAARLSQLGRYRLLSALRSGPGGSARLSDAIDQRMRHASGASPHDTWYPGRLIMLTQNLRTLGRVNGDIGLCCRQGAHLGVLFDDAAGPQWLPVSQLPMVEPAWCLTVHKSQGSEFDEVELVLAPENHPLARRELVYTGVTRARRSVRLWGTMLALEQAARQRVERLGTLAARLVTVIP